MKVFNNNQLRLVVLTTLCMWGATQVAFSQSGLALRWIPSWDCQKEIMNATLQVKSAAKGENALGTSSIYLTYNTDALMFNEYKSLNFHEKNLCIGGSASAWDEHAFDGTSKPGHFNMTMILNLDGVDCPSINGEEWTDVGMIGFSVVDKTQRPNIEFHELHTHFNGYVLNDGTEAFSLDQVDYPAIEEWECGLNIGKYLSAFDVKQEALNAFLKWEIEKKIPAGSRFEIERSFDSQIFSTFGEVEVMNASEDENYTYLDTEVNHYSGQTLFYRIKMVNPEGDHTYTEVKALDIGRLEEFPLQLSPNPASSRVDISMNLPQEGYYTLSVLNPLGQKVHTERINGKAQFLNHQVDVSDLSPGIYIINLAGESHVGAGKLTVK